MTREEILNMSQEDFNNWWTSEGVTCYNDDLFAINTKDFAKDFLSFWGPIYKKFYIPIIPLPLALLEDYQNMSYDDFIIWWNDHGNKIYESDIAQSLLESYPFGTSNPIRGDFWNVLIKQFFGNKGRKQFNGSL